MGPRKKTYANANHWRSSVTQQRLDDLAASIENEFWHDDFCMGILEIYWNLKSLLEIQEISWNLIVPSGIFYVIDQWLTIDNDIQS